MSLVNDCCRDRYNPDADTGDEYTCICGNQFIYTGDAWRNVLDLGTRKTEKYRRIKLMDQTARRIASDAGIEF